MKTSSVSPALLTAARWRKTAKAFLAEEHAAVAPPPPAPAPGK